MRVITSLTCAVALTLALAPGARADENDRLTYMTFSGPVQIPGVTLAAGTYTFKIADTQSNRHVVQVFTKDDNKLITTLMTIPNERLEPVKDTFVMFAERPAGTPVAVKAWFYPGRSIGEEFLDPRNQALKIAQAVHEPVLTTEGDEATTSGSAARVDERGTVTTVNESRTTASTATTTAPSAAAAATVAETNQPTTTADRATTTARARERSAESAVGTSGQATTANPPAPVATPAPRERLPRTASPIALFELLSGLSVAAGFGVRQLRKRS
jgi:hypothetical protein